MKFPGRKTILILLATIPMILSSGCSPGPAGASVSGALVDGTGHLVLTLTDGRTVDAGAVVGPTGLPGPTAVPAVFEDVVPRIDPAIVRIDVTVAGGLDSGSGTIVDKRGYVTTNAHVVSGAQSISATLMDGTVLPATVVASSTSQDLALLKLTSGRTDFPVVTLGTMADVAVGKSVMAAGFPGGTNLPGPATFTEGVVSALRTYAGARYIQTDTPINPGNSGGCLFTLDGRMVGIPSAGLVPTGKDFENINFVIPIDMVSAFLAQSLK